MSDSVEEDTDISESELDAYADSCYDQLSRGDQMLNVSGDVYKCPYCPGKKKQTFSFNELLQHAAGVSQGSIRRGTRDKGRHLGLEKYMHEAINGERSTTITVENDECKQNELFVWPWVGIVANICVQWKDAHCFRESSGKLKDELIKKGFNPVRIRPLLNSWGHSGYAIVEFRTDWLGLFDALRFEKAYEANYQGKRDYLGVAEKGDKIYCWVARDDDFHAQSKIGEYLQTTGNLKTVAQYHEDEKIKNSRLISKLTDKIEVQDMHIVEVETKYKETSISLCSLISRKDEMARAFNEERQKLQQCTSDELKRIFEEHDKTTIELELLRNKLEQREQDMKELEDQNENERRRLYHEREQIERAVLAQKRADKKVLELEREKEELQGKIINLEKELHIKQALEMETQNFQGDWLVRKHTEDNEDDEVGKKAHIIQQEHEERKEEVQHFEDISQAPIVEECKRNDELQEARKELIKCKKNPFKVFTGESSDALIGNKRMCELKPLRAEAKRKYLDEGTEVEGAAEVSVDRDGIVSI